MQVYLINPNNILLAYFIFKIVRGRLNHHILQVATGGRAQLGYRHSPLYIYKKLVMYNHLYRNPPTLDNG